ncbi:MAG TPA: YHS domain-containing (seleno)protein [Acidobacteriota bacterium]|nr:YHS domain-containing (seleno)protein [Acidobacteriota bacterium]
MKRIATLTVLCLTGLFGTSFAGIEINTSTGLTLTGEPLALHGFDAVAYFTDGAAKLGKAEFSVAHQGATYRFVSQSNKRMFERNPAGYLPQYGGYCAYGTFKGKKFDGDPRLFKVVNGKLYFNLNPAVYELWLKDIPGHIKKADENWREIRDKEPDDLW